MAKRLDQILVIDIESTCWEGGFPPKGQFNDVIEIGICPLEVSTLRRLEKRSLLIKPERSEVSAFCTSLTSITPEMLLGAMSFREACRIMREEFRSEQRLFASYGDYDRRQIDKQCRETGQAYPFGPTHLNIKNLFAVGRALPQEVGLPQAMELIGLPLEGTHHRGHDDAWNIAAILAHVLATTRGASTHAS